jgi:outer membrane lipoprotein-sorting protein
MTRFVFRSLFAQAILIAFAVLLFAQAPARALDRQLTEREITLINEISQHHTDIRTMVGRFLQVNANGDRLEGVFWLARPNKIRFRYGPPSFTEIITAGSGFYVVDRREKTSTAYPQDKVPLRQFLSDRIDLLAANLTDVIIFDDTPAPTEEVPEPITRELIAVSLADDTPIGVVEVTLIFETVSKDLIQWSLIEPNGGELTFSIFDTRTNVEIPRNYFSINPDFVSNNN